MRFNLAILVLALFTLGLAGCGDSDEIKLVKSGKLSACPGKTVEQMANDFYGSPSWESGVGSDGPTKGMTLVNLRGKATLQGKEVETVVQFIVDEKSGSFQAHAMEANGVPQSPFMMGGLLSAMCQK